MTLVDLLIFYLILGVGSCFLVSRRRRGSPVDLGLTLLLWPLVAPVALSASEGRVQKKSRENIPDFDALIEALKTLQESRIAALLPTPAQLEPLRGRLNELEARGSELREVLAQGEFSSADEPEVQASRSRLAALRDEALCEQRELLALCRRLRAQVLVLRFSGANTGDVKELVAELLGRVEGAQAALDPS